MLLNWGDRLFQEPFRHARTQRLSQASLRDEAARMREQLARTLRRTPEVMIKITNKASSAQGIGAVRRHLRYISRNGQVELEDQNGDRIAGAEAVRDLVQTWQFGGWGMPEASARREVFNILLSMPPGTNRQAVRDAARDFAAIEFGDGRAYVFAAHDDEAHPHVHLSVQVRGPDGRRLNPRKQDLRRWRERFAEQLRANGVDANATPRRVRGETRRYPTQGVRHMLERGEAPKYWRPVGWLTITHLPRGARWHELWLHRQPPPIARWPSASWSSCVRCRSNETSLFPTYGGILHQSASVGRRQSAIVSLTVPIQTSNARAVMAIVAFRWAK
jgi:hypothetical protein